VQVELKPAAAASAKPKGSSSISSIKHGEAKRRVSFLCFLAFLPLAGCGPPYEAPPRYGYVPSRYSPRSARSDCARDPGACPSPPQLNPSNGSDPIWPSY
jgi:hypothetical protein